MAKYFGVPFGVDGDRATIPTDAQPDGSLSYEQGYPVNYELDPGTDPEALNIPRDQFNEMIYEMQNSIRVIQEYGFPEFIEPSDNEGVAFPYEINATVRYTNGWAGSGALNYYSLVDANTANPTDNTKWGLVQYGTQYTTGDFLPWMFNTIKAGGWLWLNGTTIGSASSGATQRANADTLALYTLFWNDFSNAQLPIQDSSGVATTRGVSAAADFAANKRLPLPNAMNAALVGKDGIGGATQTGRITTGGSGMDGTTLGVFGGAQNVALTSNQNGPHTHAGTTASAGTHTHTGSTNTTGAHQHNVPYRTSVGEVTLVTPASGNSIASIPTDVQGNHSHTLSINSAGDHQHSFTTGSSGIGEAHLNVQPSLVIAGWIIKI